MVLVIGLTGGIGSGKSAISEWFKRLGITIADVDMTSRKVSNQGGEGSYADDATVN